MGSIVSRRPTIPQFGYRERLCSFDFPEFYLKDVVIEQPDILDLQAAWDLIVRDTSPHYLLLDEETKAQFPNCAEWFASVFYDHMYEVCPQTREQFRNCSSIKKQGHELVKLITTSLRICNNIEKWDETFTALAERHAGKGVVHCQYGAMGEILFWTLRVCMGELYQHELWLKFYSKMLESIIPAAIRAERRLQSSAFHDEDDQDCCQSRAHGSCDSVLQGNGNSSNSANDLNYPRPSCALANSNITCSGVYTQRSEDTDNTSLSASTSNSASGSNLTSHMLQALNDRDMNI